MNIRNKESKVKHLVLEAKNKTWIAFGEKSKRIKKIKNCSTQ